MWKKRGLGYYVLRGLIFVDSHIGCGMKGLLAALVEAAPSLDAVDRALEELQRGLIEIDTVLAKPIPETSP